MIAAVQQGLLLSSLRRRASLYRFLHARLHQETCYSTDAMDHRSTIRCSFPNCDWGFKIANFAEVNKCYQAFHLHCITVHGLSRDDFDSFVHLDLEKLTLSLVNKRSNA
jgi:hypothetical protein